MKPDPAMEQLENRARKLRGHIIRMVAAAGSGHCGGSLSAIDILTYLSAILRARVEPWAELLKTAPAGLRIQRLSTNNWSQ